MYVEYKSTFLSHVVIFGVYLKAGLYYINNRAKQHEEKASHFFPVELLLLRCLSMHTYNNSTDVCHDRHTWTVMQRGSGEKETIYQDFYVGPIFPILKCNHAQVVGPSVLLYLLHEDT